MNNWHTGALNTSSDVSASGSYFILERLKGDAGYGLQTANTSSSVPSYINNRSFLQLDYLIYKMKEMHVILRTEINRYDNHDAAQSYIETNTVLKFTTNL